MNHEALDRLLQEAQELIRQVKLPDNRADRIFEWCLQLQVVAQKIQLARNALKESGEAPAP